MRYDLLVVGGGIHGSAVARDAALRGLEVLLLERGDLASGTSSRSSKLIHGGIRYLETGQLRLVHEALRERALLLELAPTHVRPLRFLVPHYRGDRRSRLLVRIGLGVYGALAGRHPLAVHGGLTAAEAVGLEPMLETSGLLGASLYWDAQTDDASLCVAVALDAERAGAAIKTYTSVVGLLAQGSGWRARFRTLETGEEGEVTARCVVNAAGPWAEEIRALLRPPRPPEMRRTRGTHVVIPSATRGQGLLLTAKQDGRAFFVLPWGGYSLVGTTDVDDLALADRVDPHPEEVRYLLDEAGRALPGIRLWRKPYRAFAGLRSLAREGSRLPWANTREDRIVEEGTLLTLIGGKYTTHRSLAERVVNRAVGLVRIRAGACATAVTPLPADRDERVARRRTEHKGSLRLGEGLEISEAEVVHAVRAEHAKHVEDVLLRRSRLWLDGEAMRIAAGLVAEWMAPQLGWSEAERDREARAARDGIAEEARIIEAAIEMRAEGA